MEAGDLVIEAAVAAVEGQALDRRVHDLDLGLARRLLQPLHVGHDPRLQLLEVPAAFLLELARRHLLELGAIALGGEVLDIDEEERGLVRDDGDFAAEFGGHDLSRCYNFTVMPGLGPGIHAFLECCAQGVDPGA